MCHLRYCAFFSGYGTVVIEYDFQSGIQDSEHRNPGVRYRGTKRQVYLPSTEVGKKVLQLLKRAFDARLVFTYDWNFWYHQSSEPDSMEWNSSQNQ